MQRGGIRESFTGINLAAVLATSSTMSSTAIIATRRSDLVFPDFALLHLGYARYPGLSPRQLREAQSVVETHIEEIHDAWNHHFGS